MLAAVKLRTWKVPEYKPANLSPQKAFYKPPPTPVYVPLERVGGGVFIWESLSQTENRSISESQKTNSDMNLHISDFYE